VADIQIGYCRSIQEVFFLIFTVEFTTFCVMFMPEFCGNGLFSWLAWRWMCDSPWMWCVQTTTPMYVWHEQAIIKWSGHMSLSLLATTVWRFVHLPLRLSDSNRLYLTHKQIQFIFWTIYNPKFFSCKRLSKVLKFNRWGKSGKMCYGVKAHCIAIWKFLQKFLLKIVHLCAVYMTPPFLG